MSENKGFIPFQNSGLTFVGLETGQTSVGTTPTQVLAAESGRGRVVLCNPTTNVIIYVGQGTSLTTGNGFPVLPETYTPPLEYTGNLYAMVQTTTSPLGWAALR